MKRLIHIHLLEAKYEFLKVMRVPAFVVPTVLFPMLFYIFFGVALGHQHVSGSVMLGQYLIATYGTFGVMGASLFGFGVYVAVERGQGWLQVKRTTPMPISAYFFAKMAMAMLFSLIILLGLIILGKIAGTGPIPITAVLKLIGVLIPGAIVFSAAGLAVGYFAGPNSASGIVNLIYIPMSFLSGLWIPIFVLPRAIQKIALFLPGFHLSQIALGVIGAGRGGAMLPHVIFLVVSTAVFLAIAYAGYRRDEGKMYG
jgi:ABC-2 type transport system permease protein